MRIVGYEVRIVPDGVVVTPLRGTARGRTVRAHKYAARGKGAEEAMAAAILRLVANENEGK